MGTTPHNAMRCGCGMLGEATSLKRAAKGTDKSLWRIASTENASVHRCDSWWCETCRTSHWICLDTGMGRMCQGDVLTTQEGKEILDGFTTHV